MSSRFSPGVAGPVNGPIAEGLRTRYAVESPVGRQTGFVTVELFQLIIGRSSQTSPTSAWRDGHELVLATITIGLLAIGHHYAELALLHTLLLVAAFGLLLVPGRLKMLATVPALIAIGLLVYAFFTREEDPYDYYSSAAASSSIGHDSVDRTTALSCSPADLVELVQPFSQPFLETHTTRAIEAL